MSKRVKDFRPATRNANRHTARGLSELEKSLRRDGWIGAMTTAADGEMIAGSARIEKAADVFGVEAEPIVVETDGTRPVVVIRKDIPTAADPRAQRLGLADNRIAEIDLAWDVETLAGFDATALDGLWTGEELSNLGAAWAAEHEAAAAEKDSEDIILNASSDVMVFSNAAIIDAAFLHFRKTGFPYRNVPIHVCMQEINKLANTELDRLQNSNVAYDVADTYHPHRFHAQAEYAHGLMFSPFMAFHDDKRLKRALAKTLEFGGSIPDGYFGMLSMTNTTQACSNFRPGFAAFLYRQYCQPGCTVLDTSTGYGGRLVGFMASNLAGRYIGIDPNTPTHEGNLRMAAELGFADRVELYNLPAEDLLHDVVAGRCDFAFTSPPYFSKEHYSDSETQSWMRYKTGEEWQQGFLVPMLALQFAALKPGCFALVNIADVIIKNKLYPLTEWTRAGGRNVGFEYVRTDKFTLTKRFGAGMKDEVSSEPVIVFRKPSELKRDGQQ